MKNKDALYIKVQTLIEEVDKTHRYSMSRVYGLYNEVFGTKEQPQACTSCLIRKVQVLKKWLVENENLKENGNNNGDNN